MHPGQAQGGCCHCFHGGGNSWWQMPPGSRCVDAAKPNKSSEWLVSFGVQNVYSFRFVLFYSTLRRFITFEFSSLNSITLLSISFHYARKNTYLLQCRFYSLSCCWIYIIPLIYISKPLMCTFQSPDINQTKAALQQRASFSTTAPVYPLGRRGK